MFKAASRTSKVIALQDLDCGLTVESILFFERFILLSANKWLIYIFEQFRFDFLSLPQSTEHFLSKPCLSKFSKISLSQAHLSFHFSGGVLQGCYHTPLLV